MHIIKGKKVAWINISRPTADDIAYLSTTYKIHPVILDELKGPSFRSRVEHEDDYLFLVFHMPHYDFGTQTSVKREVDFIITRDAVITVHYEDIEPFKTLTHTFEKDAARKDRALGKSSGLLMYYLLNAIHNFSMRQLNHIEEKISDLTKTIFSGNEQEMLKRISYSKREILDYQIINEPRKIILESLKEIGVKFWGENMRVYLLDLIGDQQKIAQRIANFHEIVEALEDTNGQLLNTHMNIIMQRFTVLAFLTFPLILYTSLFQISLFQIPSDERLLAGRNTFIIGFIVVTTIVLIALFIFRRKRWL